MEQESWVIDGSTYSLGYQYDNAGNRIGMQYPSGLSLSFLYDQRNLLSRIPGFFENPAWPNQRGLQYHPDGSIASVRSANGVETAYSYDARRRLAAISSGPLTLQYAYTPSSNVASITDLSSATPVSLGYGYDKAGRLISAQVLRPHGIETVQYTYDGAGNRFQELWRNDQGYLIHEYQHSYLPGNYLSSRLGPSPTYYTWGDYGQLELKTGVDYIYNSRRLMRQVDIGANTAGQYFYDPMGRRVKAVENGITTITLYSGNDIVHRVENPGLTTEVRTSSIAVNGKYLAKVVQEGANPPQKYFYHTDMVGSIRAITDESGQVVARFDYEPFGLVTQATGSQAGERQRFTGKPEDAGTGLHYFNARYYDPEVGRFTSVDPIGYGLNWYDYCYSNPLRFVDPTGLMQQPVVDMDPGGGPLTSGQLYDLGVSMGNIFYIKRAFEIAYPGRPFNPDKWNPPNSHLRNLPPNWRDLVVAPQNRLNLGLNLTILGFDFLQQLDILYGYEGIHKGPIHGSANSKLALQGYVEYDTGRKWATGGTLNIGFWSIMLKFDELYQPTSVGVGYGPSIKVVSWIPLDFHAPLIELKP